MNILTPHLSDNSLRLIAVTIATLKVHKRTSKLQFLPIISKASSVTSSFYFVVRKLSKFFNFSGGMVIL